MDDENWLRSQPFWVIRAVVKLDGSRAEALIHGNYLEGNSAQWLRPTVAVAAPRRQ